MRMLRAEKDNLLLTIDESIDLRMFEFISTISLYDFVKPNVSYNEQLTSSERDKLLNNVSLTRGLIQKGELIISKGELVNEFQI